MDQDQQCKFFMWAEVIKIPTLSPSLCLCLFLSVSLSVSLFLSLFLSLFYSFFLSLSVSISVCLVVSLFVTHSLFFSFSFLSLSLFLSFSLSLSLSLFISVYLFFLTLFLSVYLCFSLFFSLSLLHSVPLLYTLYSTSSVRNLISCIRSLLAAFPKDNPALISLTLAESAAEAERDKILGPAEAKRAAAVRSYCKRIEVMTRPELKKEVEKFKKRRQQVPVIFFSI